MTVDGELMRRILTAQAGVIADSQAQLCGVGPQTIRRRIRTGEWLRVLPKVFAIAGNPTDEGRHRAALLWAGPGAVLVGRSALAWWGLGTAMPRRVSLVMPAHRRRHSRDFVTVERFQVPAEDMVTERQVRVTSAAYSVLFACRDNSRSRAQEMLDRALMRSVTLLELWEVLDRNRGCLGAAVARQLLEAASGGAAAESERLMIALLRGAGITGWVVNQRLGHGAGSIVPDFMFEDARLIVEIDGWAFHSDPERFENDRRRQNALVNAGWTVLRFTWRQLTDDPEQVIRTVRAALFNRMGVADR